MVTGRYWHHMKPELPAHNAMDVAFQDKMVARLQELTGVALPEAGDVDAVLLKVKCSGLHAPGRSRPEGKSAGAGHNEILAS
jgi:hypothetical protein